MTDEDHRRLADVLWVLKGMVMLSGLPSALYDELYGDWERLECESLTDTSKPRMESLWFSAAAWERSRRQQTLAFELEAA